MKFIPVICLLFGLFFLVDSPDKGNALSGNELRHVAVVAPPDFVETMKPWIEFRRNQGFAIHLITDYLPQAIRGETTDDYLEEASLFLRSQIRELATKVPLEFLLLIGRGIPRSDYSNNWHQIVVAHRVPTEVVHRFGSETHIASDSWYADLNDDGFPELAVGRIPVANNSELRDIIQKIIAYESQTILDGDWQRRIHVIAGVGGFSAVIDQSIEMAVRSIFSELIPPEYEMTFTQANWKSPYCPYPPKFSETTVDRMSEGGLAWLYIGHGMNQRLDYVGTPDDNYPILNLDDVKKIDCRNGPPLAVFFACYTGAFDSPRISIAESLINSRTGPVAVIASSRTTMPYGMAVMGVEMFEVFSRITPEKRLGEILIESKQKMFVRPGAVKAQKENESAEEPGFDTAKDRMGAMLDGAARFLDPTAKHLPAQMRDHVHMLNLLGDPLLALRLPEPLNLTVDEVVYQGQELSVSGTIPTAIPGQVLVELVLDRSRQTVGSPGRSPFTESAENEKIYQQTYQAANNWVISKTTALLENGHFSCPVKIPADSFGTYIIRVSFFDGRNYFNGGHPITVRAYDPNAPRPSADTRE